MTKEILDIIAAFKEAQNNGRQTALATVVYVDGSSYRRPGARMLIEDNGRLTGAISGGCLEGDALRKALLAINQKQNKLITYNSLDEDDDVSFGVQLGCNGIVHILIEPIEPTQVNNQIALLEKCVLQRKDTVLVTLFSLKNPYGKQPGTCFFFDGNITHFKLEDQNLKTILIQDALSVLSAKSSVFKQYHELELTALVELMQPNVSLIVVGAGNDAMPLVDIASVLGWEIIVIDGKATHANKQRFPKAHHIIVAKPAEAIKQVEIDERTVIVLMTHNYNYDIAMLELLLQKKCSYIGTLGPKKRLQRMLSELQQKGYDFTRDQTSVIYGPTGLDIGAEAPEEIALSVIAEIKAVLAKRLGSSLRNRFDNIHADSHVAMDETKTIV